APPDYKAARVGEILAASHRGKTVSLAVSTYRLSYYWSRRRPGGVGTMAKTGRGIYFSGRLYSHRGRNWPHRSARRMGNERGLFTGGIMARGGAATLCQR